jgi:hypothetical protein
MIPPPDCSVREDDRNVVNASTADGAAARKLAVDLLRGYLHAETSEPDCSVHHVYPDRRCRMCLFQLQRPLIELNAELSSVKKKLRAGILPDKKLTALSKRSKRLAALIEAKLGEDWQNTVTAKRFLSVPFSCGLERKIMKKAVKRMVREERRRNLNFDGNAEVVRAKSEGCEGTNLLRDGTPCGVRKTT